MSRSLRKRVMKLENCECQNGIVCIKLNFGKTEAAARDRHLQEHPEDRQSLVIFRYFIEDLQREGGHEWFERLNSESRPTGR